MTLSPDQISLLMQIQKTGKHRFTNDVAGLGNHVTRNLYDVEINDRGRAALEGLVVGAYVVVSEQYKHWSWLHKGKVGMIKSVIFFDRAPKDEFPIPYEHTTLGWEERQRWIGSQGKNDTPCFQVSFPDKPGQTFCFYDLNDLIALDLTYSVDTDPVSCKVDAQQQEETIWPTQLENSSKPPSQTFVAKLRSIFWKRNSINPVTGALPLTSDSQSSSKHLPLPSNSK